MKFVALPNFKVVGLDVSWSWDGGWDWTSDKGDKLRDLFAVKIVQRPKEPPLYLLVLGPLCFAAIMSK